MLRLRRHLSAQSYPFMFCGNLHSFEFWKEDQGGGKAAWNYISEHGWENETVCVFRRIIPQDGLANGELDSILASDAVIERFWVRPVDNTKAAPTLSLRLLF